MSLEPSQLRTLEDKYSDFQDFVAKQKFDEAQAVIDSLREFYETEATQMEDELEKAKLAE